jgi:nucleoside-diphosphate-sugar epimerase
VVLRLGMVYGRGILMIEAARWLARRRLLAVWRDPTWIHLVSTVDCLKAIDGAVSKDNVAGIYHVGDEKPVTLQSFLDNACAVWGCPRPTRLPLWLIYTAAYLCELYATVARTPAPLTRDFIRIGRVSYWGDTRRTRADLLADLEHPTLEEGLSTLR